MQPHKTTRIKVWVDCDVGIAEMVLYLNTIRGVTSYASCQGTIGEGGPNPYRPQVMCSWTPEIFDRLKKEYDVTLMGDNWGYLHPKKTKRMKPENVAKGVTQGFERFYKDNKNG